jgi:hypothetical protein
MLRTVWVKGKSVEGVSGIFDQPAAFKNFSASAAKHSKCFFRRSLREKDFWLSVLAGRRHPIAIGSQEKSQCHAIAV